MKLTRFLRFSHLALFLKLPSISLAFTLTHVLTNTTFPEIPAKATVVPAQASVLLFRKRVVAAENNVVERNDGRTFRGLHLVDKIWTVMKKAVQPFLLFLLGCYMIYWVVGITLLILRR
ncbi:hypothetical protein BDZ45DRAFT_739158 [Acephala macrosclerotiorum]|nr:hypothetical protein BDZ45DRAFT_739158 [Acephala macrosclerotiorum]